MAVHGQPTQVTVVAEAEAAVVLRTKLEAEAIQQEELQQTTVQLGQIVQTLAEMPQTVRVVVAEALPSILTLEFVLVMVVQEL